MKKGVRYKSLIVSLATTVCLVASHSNADDRAVVIGIDDYMGVEGANQPRQAASDARRFAQFLTERMGFAENSVTLLLDNDATSDAIMNAILDDLIGGTSPGERAVFFFAGLGSRVTASDDTEPDGLTEVLLAQNADEFLGRLPEPDFNMLFDLLADRQVSIIIDAAFSGLEGLTEVNSARGIELKDVEPRQNIPSAGAEALSEPPFGGSELSRTVLTASTGTQTAWENESGGLMTELIISGIQSRTADTDNDGNITNAELTDYLARRMSVWCWTTPECANTETGLSPHFAGPPDAVIFSANKGSAGLLQAGSAQASVSTPSASNTIDELLAALFSDNNGAGLVIRIDGKTPLRIGDFVRFQVRADRSGAFALFDILQTGVASHVYPPASRGSKTRELHAGDVVTIPTGLSSSKMPLRIQITEPAGRGALLALFAEGRPEKLAELLPDGSGDLDASVFLVELADALEAETNIGGFDWSAVYLPYEIVP